MNMVKLENNTTGANTNFMVWMKKLTKSTDRRRGIGEAQAYASGCTSGGKPSTWFQPGGLIEQIHEFSNAHGVYSILEIYCDIYYKWSFSV